jgi:hypothetical protein
MTSQKGQEIVMEIPNIVHELYLFAVVIMISPVETSKYSITKNTNACMA